MSECVVCGSVLPEGYGMVCRQCCEQIGNEDDLIGLEDENTALRILLAVERENHESTRKKLEKTKHDRDRYAKRIRFMNERHHVLSALYRASQKEKEMLESALRICENTLIGMEGEHCSEKTQG